MEIYVRYFPFMVHSLAVKSIFESFLFFWLQLGTLRELQRLYDELVQSADACRLDRYSASAKSTRSNWFWNKFVSHSSVSPVKGLYLYGGVGTGKTMLMDLFFHQL